MLKRWLRWLWFNEAGFFGIGQGPSLQEQSEFNALQSLGTFAAGEGEADVLASDNFWKAVLSGDPGQIAKVLGPQMSAINRQGQQSKMTSAQFGNRGGGTNAGNQMTDDNTRTAIDSTISKLTGTAASSLGSSGGGLLGTAESADTSAFNAANTIHSQNLAKWNDIFSSTASVAAAPFTGGASLGMGSFSMPGSGGSGGGGGLAQSVPSDPTDGDFGEF